MTQTWLRTSPRSLLASEVVGASFFVDLLRGFSLSNLLSSCLLTFVALLFAAVRWRYHLYAVDDSSIHVRTGGIYRREFSARFDRIQAVHIERTWRYRLFGLCTLLVETTADHKVRLTGITNETASNLRARLIAVSSKTLPSDVTPKLPEAAPPTPNRRILQSQLLVVPHLLALGSIVLLLLSLIPIAHFAPKLFFPILGIFGGASGLAYQLSSHYLTHLSKHYNFSFIPTDAEFTTISGLGSLSETHISPNKLQTFSLMQPLLWRRHGWYKASAEIYQSHDYRTTLLPAATSSELAAVLPASYLDTLKTFLPISPLARFLDPWGYKYEGYLLSEDAILAKSGRLTRHTTLLPYAKIQQIQLYQGPVQRLLGLASLHVHAGDHAFLSIHHLSQDQASTLVDTLRLLAASHRKEVSISLTSPTPAASIR